MNGFIGNYEYSVDAKGRLNIPAKFRKLISPAAEETFVVVRGSEKSLRVYPKDEWEQYVAKVAAVKKTEDRVKYLRLMSSTANFSTLDVQGRISLTAALMEHANIAKTGEVMILGMSNYMELWNPAEFKAYSNDVQDFDSLQHEIDDEIAQAQAQKQTQE